MRQKATDSAVSEIVGSILMLAIVVGVFTLLYIGVISYDFEEVVVPSKIVGSVEGTNIVLEHKGGKEIGLNSTLVVTVGSTENIVEIGNYLDSSAVSDGKWTIGERVVYPVGDVTFMQVKVTVTEEYDNFIIMTGVLQEGEVNDMIIVTLPATEVKTDSAKFHMNYNFRNRTGSLRFAYRTYTGSWSYTSWQLGITGAGFYNETVTGLTTTLYYFKAQLRYNTNITEGVNKSFIYTGTEMNSIATYLVAGAPYGLSAQGSSLLDSVELWYRFSPDNISWSSNWWDEDWTSRRPINLFVSAGATTSDYQVLLNISYDYRMNFDFSDLRFVKYQDNITEYPYWIENKTDGERAFVWVRIDSSVTPQNDTFMWMYFGNSAATSMSDGSQVFYFFDDFIGVTLDVDWQANANDYAITDETLRIGIGSVTTTFPLTVNMNDGYVLESRIKYHTIGASYSGVLAAQSSQYTELNNNGIDATNLIHRPPSSFDLQRQTARGSTVGFDCGSENFFTTKNDIWYTLSAHFYNGGVKIYQNRTDEWLYGCGWIKDIDHISLGAYQGSASYDIQDTSYDWVLIRKYANIQPEQFFGDLEYIGWHRWNNPSNPDTVSPWAWTFNFPEGAGYYEFYSIGVYDTSEESAPASADTSCYFYPVAVPTVTTKDPVVIGSWVYLQMDYDFKDFIWGYVCFTAHVVGDPNWGYTPWVARAWAGSFGYWVQAPILFIPYEYKALLYYEGGLIQGGLKVFTPPFG